MGRSDVDDPKLAEVKAILARLQRMSPDDEPEPVAPAQVTLLREPPPVPKPERSPPPVASAAPINPPRTSLILSLLAGSASAGLLLYATSPYWLPTPATVASTNSGKVATLPVAAPAAPPVPVPATADVTPAVARPVAAIAAPPQAATTPPPASKVPLPASEKEALQRADGLIRTGKIADGRSELLRIAAGRSADVAWALARAYDPNVVGQIERADAAPDPDEATKWYRQWHTLAIEQGLVADSVSIERIIRSMKR